MDLVEEYFKRDLTEDEERLLSETLAASPEAAERLAQGMTALYLASGLPEPHWPGGDPPFPHSKWETLRPLLPMLTALILILWALLHWLPRSIPSFPSLAKPLATPIPYHAPKVKALHKVLEPILHPALNPPEGHVYHLPAAVVDLATPGLVTVRVLDGANIEIRTLYAGPLPAGKRTFTWDGKTDRGALSPAGTYFIEVKSGLKVMRQEVRVE